MKKMFSLGLAAAALALACAAQAYPTLAGPTGLAALPNAEVAAPGTLNIAADVVGSKTTGLIVVAGTTAFDVKEKSDFPVRLVYGIAPGFEVGAGYEFAKLEAVGTTTKKSANTWNINAKYMIPVKALSFDWALGARYAQTKDKLVDETGNNTEIYFVGTRAIPLGAGTGMPALAGTIGLNWTKLKGLGSDASKIRGMFGLQAGFANKLSVGAELQTKASDLESKALTSIYARYPVSPALGVELGWSNAMFGNLGADKHAIYAGLNYGFAGTK